jgi:translation initiation factor 1A
VEPGEEKDNKEDEEPPAEEDLSLPEAPLVVDGGEGIGRLPLPRREKGQLFAVANQLLGAGRIRVVCEDEVSRMGRITGRLKKKMWIREGDLLVVSPWKFQAGKADIVFRYNRTQAAYLSRRQLLPATVDLFKEVPLSTDEERSRKK